MSAGTLSGLLRSPAATVERCLRERELRELALVSICAIAAAGALFGATIGGYRGGLQVLYSALKIPVACLLTLALCAPAYYAFANAFGRAWSMRTVVSLTLAALARASLVLLAAVPVLWLMIDVGIGYHATALWASVAYGLSGLAALGVLLRALGDARHRALLALTMLLLFGMVGGQGAWLLRPYMGRPSEQEVPLLRAPDGNFAERVYRSGRSSLGIYDGPAAGDCIDGDVEQDCGVACCPETAP